MKEHPKYSNLKIPIPHWGDSVVASKFGRSYKLLIRTISNLCLGIVLTSKGMGVTVVSFDKTMDLLEETGLSLPDGSLMTILLNSYTYPSNICEAKTFQSSRLTKAWTW